MGAQSEMFVAGSTTTWHDYIYAAGNLVAERFCSGAAPCSTGAQMRYAVSDHLSSPSSLTDETGAVTERLSYDAWGQRRNANGTDAVCGAIASATTRGFTGHEMMDAVCLVNMNARLYDPAIGRFMSADSVVSDPANGQAYNRYAYVNNNPLNATDPTGFDPVIKQKIDGFNVERCLGCNWEIVFSSRDVISISNTDYDPATGQTTTICCAYQSISAPSQSSPLSFGAGGATGNLGRGGESGGGGSGNAAKAAPSKTADNRKIKIGKCTASPQQIQHAKLLIRGGTDVQLIGGGVAAVGLGITAGSQILGGGPEDPLSDIGSAFGTRITQIGLGAIGFGTSAQNYGAAFLATNGMPRDAINTAVESYLDKLDLVAPFAAPAIGQLEDKGLNPLEDALGVPENVCH